MTNASPRKIVRTRVWQLGKMYQIGEMCSCHDGFLNETSSRFIADIHDLLVRGEYLTKKQEEHLERLLTFAERSREQRDFEDLLEDLDYDMGDRE